jgi:hypothetical protein
MTDREAAEVPRGDQRIGRRAFLKNAMNFIFGLKRD